MRIERKTLAAFAVIALGAGIVYAAPDPAAGKLGEAYEKASPADKIAMISVGAADKVLDYYKEAGVAVEAVTTAECDKGKTNEERLKLMGALRKASQEKVKSINEERKGQKKQGVSCMDPDGNYQTALALAYVVDAAGPSPTIEQLGCLKLVRDCTSWTSNGKLITSLVTEALARDKDYMAADHAGKLEFLKKRVSDREMASDFERSVLEQAVLGDWMSKELKGGKSPADVSAALRKIYDAKTICFFAHSWADGILKKMDFKK